MSLEYEPSSEPLHVQKNVVEATKVPLLMVLHLSDSLL